MSLFKLFNKSERDAPPAYLDLSQSLPPPVLKSVCHGKTVITADDHSCKGNMHYGLKHGHWKRFTSDTEKTGDYEYGMRHGDFYFRNSSVEVNCHYVKGEIDGTLTLSTSDPEEYNCSLSVKKGMLDGRCHWWNMKQDIVCMYELGSMVSFKRTWPTSPNDQEDFIALEDVSNGGSIGSSYSSRFNKLYHYRCKRQDSFISEYRRQKPTLEDLPPTVTMYYHGNKGGYYHLRFSSTQGKLVQQLSKDNTQSLVGYQVTNLSPLTVFYHFPPHTAKEGKVKQIKIREG